MSPRTGSARPGSDSNDAGQFRFQTYARRSTSVYHVGHREPMLHSVSQLAESVIATAPWPGRHGRCVLRKICGRMKKDTPVGRLTAGVPACGVSPTAPGTRRRKWRSPIGSCLPGNPPAWAKPEWTLCIEDVQVDGAATQILTNPPTLPGGEEGFLARAALAGRGDRRGFMCKTRRIRPCRLM